ncbi:MAG: hypothetical protein QW112_02755, partial [Candidatus Micrarchaeia archaeon]
IFGAATEKATKTCTIGIGCLAEGECYDSRCIDGTCACCIETCVRTADCCVGYCENNRCKLPPQMMPFIVRKPMFSGCTGLIEECLPDDKGCLSICHAMTVLLAIVAVGNLYAFWKMYQHPVVAIAGAAIPLLVAVLTYSFAGIIVGLLMIGLMFAK